MKFWIKRWWCFLVHSWGGWPAQASGSLHCDTCGSLWIHCDTCGSLWIVPSYWHPEQRVKKDEQRVRPVTKS